MALKSELTEEIGYWHTLFKANGWKDVTLLNEVAQIELYHHLDGPLSQEISYRHSQQGAQRAESLNENKRFHASLLPHTQEHAPGQRRRTGSDAGG
jgi:hypothetical protein